jgi:hypothetical protein
MAYPPLAVLLVLAQGGGDGPGGLRIDEFTEQPPGTRMNYEGEIDVGFGHTPLPGDYRPTGGIEADR